MTRARAGDAEGLNDVTKFIQEQIEKSSARSRSSGAQDAVRTRIDERLRKISSNKKLFASDEYCEAVTGVLDSYLRGIIEQMQLVSKHRAGLSVGPPIGQLTEVEMTTTKTDVEEWLLYKEDCAAFITKQALDKSGEPVAAPTFSKSDYAMHAQEEEERMLITAQSVRRITLRDILPLLSGECAAVKIPSSVQQRMVNTIAAHELVNEYVSRNNGFSLTSS